MWTMPLGSSSVSPIDRHARMAGVLGTGRAGRRAAMSSGTATMSARGTITSSTRRRWRSRMFLSSARSSGENRRVLAGLREDVGEVVADRIGERTCSSWSRRSYQDSRAPSPIGRAGRAGLGTSVVGHRSGRRRSSGGAVGVGDPDPRQRPGLERLHDLGLRTRLVIIADQVQHAVHDEMERVVSQGLALRIGFAPHRRKQGRCRRDGAAPARRARRPPGTTARWSGGPGRATGG